MSNVKISNLTATTELADDDLLAVVDESDTAQAASGSTRKTLLSTLRSWLGKDEDDMASDSATHFPTQQSVKAYVDAETSQLLPLDGSEGMTNALIVKSDGSISRRIEFQKADGTRCADIVNVSGTSLRLRQFNSDGTAVLSDLQITGTGINVATGTVTVPAPTADSHAATKAYVDAETSQLLPLNGSEDMTGDLAIRKNNAAITLDDNLGTSGERRWRIVSGGDFLRFDRMSDDGTSVNASPLQLDAVGVTVPAPTADSHAATKEYVDDETSQLLTADNPTATGILAVSDTDQGIIDLTDDNGTADAKRSRIVNGAEATSIRSLTDAGATSKVGFRFDHATGDVTLAESSGASVTVPAPTADSHAATKAYVDDETSQLAPLASPTLTGNVIVPDANADGEAIAYDQSGWILRNGTIVNGNDAVLRIDGNRSESTFGSYLMLSRDEIDKYAIAVKTGDNLVINRYDPTTGAYVGEQVLMDSDGAMFVPAPTGANQPIRTAAAPVSATGFTGLDATSDTGSRQVSSLLLNGWTSVGVTVRLRRIGSLVQLQFPYRVSAGTDPHFMDLPAGFRPEGNWALETTLGFVNGQNGTTQPERIYTVAGTGDLHCTGTGSQNTGFVQWTTADAWPSSLPGSPG